MSGPTLHPPIPKIEKEAIHQAISNKVDSFMETRKDLITLTGEQLIHLVAEAVTEYNEEAP